MGYIEPKYPSTDSVHKLMTSLLGGRGEECRCEFYWSKFHLNFCA